MAQQVGFTSSWKMLTSEKGWWKPVLVLALIGWIPVIGPIALLGYGMEWARYTAWGQDRSPQQAGIDVGKLLATGGRAFLVYLSISLVLGLVGSVFLGGFTLARLLTLTAYTSPAFAIGGFLTGRGILGIVLAPLFGAFVFMACIRTTLYDSFSAGWRLDRVCQMIGRDVGGACRVWLVTFIGGVLCALYTIVMTVLGLFVVGASALGVVAQFYHGAPHNSLPSYLLAHLVDMGIGSVLFLLIAAAAVLVVYGMLAIAMQLVSMHAVGQWFSNFEVGRWGISSAPLPDGVPVHPASGQPGSQSWDGTPRDPWKASQPWGAPPASSAASTPTGQAPSGQAMYAQTPFDQTPPMQTPPAPVVQTPPAQVSAAPAVQQPSTETTAASVAQTPAEQPPAEDADTGTISATAHAEVEAPSQDVDTGANEEPDPR